ncbi:YhcN/YlaJ family sporulation lipoprotein [Domibacillus indicus]|uniref:YhcN/YlaJ family sporulation lipoprotein n=1 Tax=Domibacillus indicus TaxID=1437523 RepID=UPI0006986D0B|nr:YhcN/YlaJ family sporulation lipoprotein [Domibacillus indicus]
MKKTAIYAAALMTTFLLGACMNNDNAADNNRQNNQPQNVSYDQQGGDLDTNGSGDGTGGMGGGTNNGTNGANGPDNNTGNGGDNQNDLGVNEEAANRVGDMKEVEDTTVMVTGQTAYVAVNLKNQQELSDDLKQKIEQRVKEADNSVETVYVSADPDFSNRMRNYADRIDNGEPVQGFFDEFGESVRRVFPNS